MLRNERVNLPELRAAESARLHAAPANPVSMSQEHLTIGFVRRGFSSSGGAETYLQRLAQGIAGAGHEGRLFTTEDWPRDQWTFGPLTYLRETSAGGFAREFEQLRRRAGCDIFLSLERILSCDVYRAGDGVHRAWLERRAKLDGPMQKLLRPFNPKQRDLLRLETALLGGGGAKRVIANSEMVKQEIIRFYDYPPERIDLVYNGVPVAAFAGAEAQRAARRAALGLNEDELAVLFAGSGWERKGLRFAVAAVEACQRPPARLLVAGRGEPGKFPSPRTSFLGVVHDLPALYAAADVFLLPTLYDPFSNACLEASAAGLPVITTSSNGFAEIMQEGVTGSIVPNPDDIAGLRRALQYWSDATRRAGARTRLRQLAAQFDISKNVDRTLEILVQSAARAAST